MPPDQLIGQRPRRDDLRPPMMPQGQQSTAIAGHQAVSVTSLRECEQEVAGRIGRCDGRQGIHELGETPQAVDQVAGLGGTDPQRHVAATRDLTHSLELLSAGEQREAVALPSVAAGVSAETGRPLKMGGAPGHSLGRAGRPCGGFAEPTGNIYSVRNSVTSRRLAMGVSARDVVPLTQARANLSELAEQVRAGAEKIITKNGESYVALIDADRLDYYHRLERERIHLLLLDDARRGLEDVAAGRTREADAAIAQLQKRRARAGDPQGKGSSRAKPAPGARKGG